MNEGGIRGVIFDLDGTLYSMRGLKMRMAVRLVTSLKYLRKLSHARKPLRGTVFDGPRELRAATFEKLAELVGRTPKDAEDWFDHRFMPAFVDVLKVRGKKRWGVEEFLSTLRQRGVRTAVVSDFGSVGPRLDSLCIPRDLFDGLHATEDFGALKPSPVSVLEVARKWSIAPDRVVVVGDRVDLDGQCARSAGMGFVGITESPAKAGVDFVDWKTAVDKIDGLTKESGAES